MSHLGWMAFCGILLLAMALSSAYIQRLPISTSLIYLLVGVTLGPLGVGALSVDLTVDSAWLERLTEVAVMVSLFVGGLKLRLPFGAPAWRAPLRLAGPLMLVCIAGVAAFAHWGLGMPFGAALLLGAVLAPTDPVLASAVAVSNASDHDRLRYGLSGEAGLNDGAAFPFVVLALMWLEHDGAGGWLGGWALHRLLWAVPAGLLLGYVLGRLVGRLAVHVRSHERDDAAPSDFLALSLIALAYVGAEAIQAWGFLAVFAAGMGLRKAELNVVRESPHPGRPHAYVPHEPHAEGADAHPPAEHLVDARPAAVALEEPAVAAGSMLAEMISFGDTAERLLEVTLVILVGVALAVHWDGRGVLMAAVLMLFIRPLGAQLVLLATPTTQAQRWLMGWFGIRGIGSLYYVAYAVQHGLSPAIAADVSALAVTVVAISVVVHGISATPLLERYAATLPPGDSPAPSRLRWRRPRG